MELAFDIETSGLLDETALEYPEMKLKPSYKVHCIVFQDINTREVYKFYKDNLNECLGLLKKATKLIGHNLISFDMLVMKLFFGVDYTVSPDTVMGKDVEIIDTLIMSKLLNPDRQGGHSLKIWGKRLGFNKGDYGEVDDNDIDVWEEFNEEMLEYCVRDVELTAKVYKYLVEQEGFYRWDWKDAFELEKAVREIITRQEHVGFWFDKEKAIKNHKTLSEWMDAIEAKVEPQLPKKPITKTAAKDYIPPVRQFKKDGTAAADLGKFAAKHGGELIVDEEGKPVKMVLPWGEYTEFPLPREPMVTQEEMKLSDQKWIKQHLVELGWVPTEFGDRDLTTDAKGRKQSREKTLAAIDRYVEDCKDNPFTPYRLEHLECKSLAELEKNLKDRNLNRSIKVLTSPKFTVGLDKDIDPALEAVDGADYGQDIADWLTYRHRKNAIKSEKGTGFLNTMREDGRISTPADTLGAVSGRFTHKNVANIARVTSKFGAEMRELFGVDEGMIQIGVDIDSLEASIEGHYCMKYNGGPEYAVALVSPKPNDIHTVTAKKMGVSRDAAKSTKYGCSYGANWPKLKKMLGVSDKEAKAIFNDFWAAAQPLADLKEKATKYWETAGNKAFILGLDGRKLWVRSPHAILNTLFQSAGVICAKRAMVIWDRWIKERKLDDKVQQMIAYHI